jgi:hypothetical protein
MRKILLAALALAANAVVAHAQISPSAPSYSADELARRMIERRAVEAVIWGMPAVNTELMYQAMQKLGGKPPRTGNSRCDFVSMVRKKPVFDKTWSLPDIDRMS